MTLRNASGPDVSVSLLVMRSSRIRAETAADSPPSADPTGAVSGRQRTARTPRAPAYKTPCPPPRPDRLGARAPLLGVTARERAGAPRGPRRQRRPRPPPPPC